MARYQSIIDVLVDSGRFGRIYFDHETELPVPYRGVGFLKRNALQEESGKGRHLHKKWADICGIQNSKLKVIVEEERKAMESKVIAGVQVISRCKYLWTDGREYAFDPACVLFIILNENMYGVRERTLNNVGNLKAVVVCNKESFRAKFGEYAN